MSFLELQPLTPQEICELLGAVVSDHVEIFPPELLYCVQEAGALCGVGKPELVGIVSLVGYSVHYAKISLLVHA